VSLAYATRRAISIGSSERNSPRCRTKVSKRGSGYECQLENLESAKNYLKQAIKIDSSWRIAALNDKDLEPLWDFLQATTD
jgi:hypothetical protein